MSTEERVAILEAHRENHQKEIGEMNVHMRDLLRVLTTATEELRLVNSRLESGQKKMELITVQVDGLSTRTSKVETSHEVMRGQLGVLRWIAGLLGIPGIAAAMKAFIGVP